MTEPRWCRECKEHVHVATGDRCPYCHNHTQLCSDLIDQAYERQVEKELNDHE